MGKFKTFVRKVYYSYIIEYIYSFRYSIKKVKEDIIDYFKSLVADLIELISEFKNPKTWSSFLFLACIYAIVTRKYSLFKWLIPLLILVGMIRQKKARAYKKELMKNALLKDNNLILAEEYEKYKTECFHSKRCELGFEDWKSLELEKVQMNNK